MYACCNKAVTVAVLNDLVSGVVGKGSANQAADQALAFGKKLLDKCNAF